MDEHTFEEALAEVQSIQDTYGGEYDSWSRQYLDRHREYYLGVCQLVDDHLTDPLLEVGSAPFHLTGILDNLGYDLVGLDVDPGRMEEIIDDLALEVKRCDIETDRFPFEDDSFSGVLFTEVLEHLRMNPIWTLKEIHRVLEPNGRLLLTTPNLTSIYNLHSFLTEGKITDPYDQFIKLEEIGHMGHVREYAPAEVSSLLRKTGFRTLDRDFANWMRESWLERSLIHNVGIAASELYPKLKHYQIHIATPEP